MEQIYLGKEEKSDTRNQAQFFGLLFKAQVLNKKFSIFYDLPCDELCGRQLLALI